jgi:protein-arginine kinase activator protein McsA
VAEKVMDEAGRVFPEEEKEKTTKAAESPKEDAKPRLSPVEVLQRRLAGLIERERYEEAAKVRDEIQRLQNRPAHN